MESKVFTSSASRTLWANRVKIKNVLFILSYLAASKLKAELPPLDVRQTLVLIKVKQVSGAIPAVGDGFFIHCIVFEITLEQKLFNRQSGGLPTEV